MAAIMKNACCIYVGGWGAWKKGGNWISDGWELFNIGKLNTVLTIKKLEFLEVKIKLWIKVLGRNVDFIILIK